MTKRITLSLVVAIGLVALGCGGGADAEPQPVETAGTAGMEAPPSSVPQNQQARTTIPEGAQPGTAPPGTVAPSTTQPGTSEPLLVISDAEVASFVDTLVQLAILEQQGMQRIEAGETQEQVQASLQPQVDSIFASTELTPKRFSDIAAQADRDPALAQRIETQLEQRLASASPPA